MRSPRITCLVAGATLLACTKSETPPDTRPSCEFHADCAAGTVCDLGRCTPTAPCLERADCSKVLPLCEGARCLCPESQRRCIPVCVTDLDCSEAGQCVDGICTPYPVRFDGLLPPSGPRGPLKVGLGVAELDFPMGVSMAGYASRQGPRTPYQDSLGGSNAWFDRPEVRALALDDGKEMFVLLRIPMGWSTDEMFAATVLKVQAKTGLNLHDHLITSATHSHAQPARFWHLVKGLGFGFFGYDEFSFEVFDRLTSSFADAVVMALEDMQPGRIGYVVLDDPDPEDRISRDRRRVNNGLPGAFGKDGRMIVLRVDDRAGHPLAVLVNFGMHGTIFDLDNPVLTGDAPIGVEYVLTARASEKYGRPVLGFYLQGDAGDVSPSGDDLGHNGFERIQLVGERAWDIVGPALDTVVTKDQVRIALANERIAITHDALGYGPTEFYDETLVSCQPSAPVFRYGAFQCAEGIVEDEDPATHLDDGNLNCVFSVECLSNGHGVPQFHKTHLAAVQIDDLVFVTMPGEPLSKFGRDLAERVREAVPGARVAAVLGYSQDHHFYLLNEDDWLQGGYEPSRDIWGFRFGPFLQDHSVRIARQVALEPEERTLDHSKLKPMIWTDPPEEREYHRPNEGEGPPEDVLLDLPPAVERLSVVDFSWRGGHPGVDRPRVSLEVMTASGAATFLRPGGLPYDDTLYEMLVRYEGSCSKVECVAHQWRVRWDRLRDFPLGRYRLRVQGRALAAGQLRGYTTHSRVFDVVPATRLELYDLAIRGDALEGRVVDPAALRFHPEGGRQVAEEDTHLLRSRLVPGYLGAPLGDGAALTVRGRVRPPGGAPEAFSLPVRASQVVEPRRRLVALDAAGTPEWRGVGPRATTSFSLNLPALANGPGGDYYLELEVEDALGNRGTVTATITR